MKVKACMFQLSDSFYSFNFNDITYVSFNYDLDKATLFIKYDDKYLEITKHNTDDKNRLKCIYDNISEYIFNKEPIERWDYFTISIKEVQK